MPKPSWTELDWTGLDWAELGREGQSNRIDLIAPLNLLSSADFH